jgi:hypothetical protein
MVKNVVPSLLFKKTNATFRAVSLAKKLSIGTQPNLVGTSKAAPRRRMPSGGVWFAAASKHGELQAEDTSLQIASTFILERLSYPALFALRFICAKFAVRNGIGPLSPAIIRLLNSCHFRIEENSNIFLSFFSHFRQFLEICGVITFIC